MFVEIEPDFLSSIATDSDRIPTLYFSKYWPVRKFFWMRLRLIHQMMKECLKEKTTCLDFGGGGGVFLPTLSRYFEQVFLIDLENSEAVKVADKYRLKNVVLFKEDISNHSLQNIAFDAIIAADVLEHFSDLSVPVRVLKELMHEDTILFTSLPTENLIYIVLRKIFNIEKPWDHYHTASEVECFLQRSGFKRVSRSFVPFFFNFLPLFRISAWQLKVN